jgi:1,4-alpha-glucan branching enzyme
MKQMYSNFEKCPNYSRGKYFVPMVPGQTSIGGLGFGMKEEWMIGWMHDSLSKDTVYRKYHQNDLTFSTSGTFSRKFHAYLFYS